ncbi:hypothetical protein BKP56_02470 [Marinilactibacillus sp. 15R]|uniref:DUF58 domain-containing protein n=1 Tax=Marinilactibacillus sp. 15R TaxID=1911586 RepID=UPI00090A8A84|nr:DUF58 domain-containing protein [Marinilactibacillus sp. 15R]API88233.1 hypothetical protein BKP56_02470 [Marinilactibacillus sp. 15R]
MKRYLPSWRFLSFFFLYLLITLYTFTFPETVTWFIFYAFTLVLLIAFLSTPLNIQFKDIDWKIHDNGTVDLIFTLTPRWSLAFMMSSLKLTLLESSSLRTIYPTAFFKHMIQVRFGNFSLTRGQYNHLTLEIKGYGLFGIFKYYSKQNIPVLISIFPTHLTKKALVSLIDTQSIKTAQSSSFSHHEFQVKEIRQYQSRDSLSAIDWKSSLKREQWMVKEYDTEEIRPITLCFFGSSSLQFEELLNLTYSLYQHLSISHKIRLLLIGDFDGVTLSKDDKRDFLTIQPSADTQKIKKLIDRLDYTAEQLIIVKPSDLTIPVYLSQPASCTIMTEKQLTPEKGEGLSE